MKDWRTKVTPEVDAYFTAMGGRIAEEEKQNAEQGECTQSEYCHACGMLNSQCGCWDAVNKIQH